MMKNLMRSRGWGVLPLCSPTTERCAVLSHSLVLRNTSTSLGSKGTSELQSSSLRHKRRCGNREEGRQHKEFWNYGNLTHHNSISIQMESSIRAPWCVACVKRVLTSEAPEIAHQWASRRRPQMPPTTAADNSHLSAGRRKGQPLASCTALLNYSGCIDQWNVPFE